MPSFDIHFKRHFAAHLLRDGSFAEEVIKDLKPEIFMDEALQRVVRIAIDFFRHQQNAPGDLLYRLLEEHHAHRTLTDDQYVACRHLAEDLLAVPLQNRGYLLAQFNQFLRHETWASRLPAINDLARAGDFDQAEAQMKDLLTFRPSRATDLGRVYTADTIATRLRRRESDDARRLWTLIPKIDRHLPGLKGGEIGIIQSKQSSDGKSAALAYFARSFAVQGRNVMLYTVGDMSEDMYEDRLDMLMAGVTSSNLLDGARIQAAVRKLQAYGGAIRYKQFPAYRTRVSDLREHATRVEATCGFKPGVIIIDYACLLAPETPSLRSSSYDTGAEVYSVWKQWLEEEDIPGWTAMQSNRGAAQASHADQQHAGGSLAKIQIADVVLSIQRDDTEMSEKLTRIHWVKARNAKANFSVTIPSDLERMQFWDGCREMQQDTLGT